jgi:hypothetical protein
MKQLISNAFITIILLSSASVSAQDAPATNATKQQAKPSYEIVISPTVTRGRLRELVVQVEDDFFAKFNELNIDDDYDVLCLTNKSTESYIPKRVCEPQFIINARNLSASKAGNAIGKLGQFNDGYLQPQVIQSNESPKYEILQEKLEQFTRTDEEFRSIGNALAKLRIQLENYGEED